MFSKLNDRRIPIRNVLRFQSCGTFLSCFRCSYRDNSVNSNMAERMCTVAAIAKLSVTMQNIHFIVYIATRNWHTQQ